jgi:hypothetical protein
MPTRSNDRMPRGARTILDRFNLGDCFRTTDGGSSWIARCRHCSAGWLIPKDAREAPELAAHALKHAIVIHRLPCVARPIRRRVVVRVGGRMIIALTQRVSPARAAMDCDHSATVEITYESSGSAHDVAPFGSPPLSTARRPEFHTH